MAMVSPSFLGKGYSLVPGLTKVPGFLREFIFQHETTKYGHLMPNSMQKFGKRRFFSFFLLRTTRKGTFSKSTFWSLAGHISSGDM